MATTRTPRRRSRAGADTAAAAAAQHSAAHTPDQAKAAQAHAPQATAAPAATPPADAAPLATARQRPGRKTASRKRAAKADLTEPGHAAAALVAASDAPVSAAAEAAKSSATQAASTAPAASPVAETAATTAPTPNATAADAPPIDAAYGKPAVEAASGSAPLAEPLAPQGRSRGRRRRAATAPTAAAAALAADETTEPASTLAAEPEPQPAAAESTRAAAASERTDTEGPLLAANADALAPVTEAVIGLLHAGSAAADATAGQSPVSIGADGPDQTQDSDVAQADREPAAPPQPRAPRPPAAVPVAPPLPSGQATSRIEWVAGDRALVRWRPGSDCPGALAAWLQPHLRAEGEWPAEADGLLPQLLRQAADARHGVHIDAGVWPLWAAHRDARSRAAVLQALYPQGPDSPALHQLLAAPLAPFQAEGALWAVVAGRGLLADAPGLGKGVQALAAAQLWRRHFGLERVLVLCPEDEAIGWAHACWRLAGVQAQVLSPTTPLPADDGAGAGVRIATPAVHALLAQALADWAPQLLIVDEPQRLNLPAGGPATWHWPEAPHQLVLCGAPLEHSPELLDALVDQLDPQRLGPLAALRQVSAVQAGAGPLDEAALEAVSDALSRILLQRQVVEVRDQLPDVLWHPSWFTPGPAQRERHDLAVRSAQRALRAALAAQHLADADQWRLSQALVDAQALLHAPATDPQAADGPASTAATPYSDALRQALDAAVAEALWVVAQDAEALLDPDGASDARPGQPPAGGGSGLAVVVLVETPAEAAWLNAQGTARFGPAAGAMLHIQGPDQPLTGRPAAIVQVGAPWRLPQRKERTRSPLPQRRWAVMAAGSADMALWDTIALRESAPRGPAEPGGQGFLDGDRRNAWLLAVTAWLNAMAPSAPL